MRTKVVLAFTAILQVFSVTSIGSPARAAMSEREYQSALKIADQYVQRRKGAAGSAGAVSASLARSLLGRFYRVGDRWDVAAFHEIPTMVRKMELPEGHAHLSQKEGLVGIFRYEVTDVVPGESPRVTVKVTQIAAYGQGIVDPQVERIELTIDDSLVQKEKVYQISGRSERTVLDVFPLNFADVATADRKEGPAALPELPSKLQAVATKAGYRPDLGRCSWFEQSDFYGRPVQVMWQQGDPWPSYLKTASGVAVLVGRRTQ